MKTSSSLYSHLETAEPDHLVTHLRQNSKNEIRKMLTVDPATMETTRKAKILQSFANKKIAIILRADLEKNYGPEITHAVFNEEAYQAVVSHGLTVAQGRSFYVAAASLQPTI